MKRTIFFLFSCSVFFSSCKKETDFNAFKEDCLLQIDNPSGRIYNPDSFVSIQFAQKACGFIPLSSNSYWVYEDSFFNAGSFVSTQMDTLRFTKNFLSLSDKLIWWQSSINVGLPAILYSNDSAIFQAVDRVFFPSKVIDASKEFSEFSGDSLTYLSSFDDNAAIGKAKKLEETITTPYGSYDGCILFEKKAPFSRRDQVIFKPGLGVIKYRSELAPMSSPEMQLQQISTLRSFYLN